MIFFLYSLLTHTHIQTHTHTNPYSSPPLYKHSPAPQVSIWSIVSTQSNESLRYLFHNLSSSPFLNQQRFRILLLSTNLSSKHNNVSNIILLHLSKNCFNITTNSCFVFSTHNFFLFSFFLFSTSPFSNVPYAITKSTQLWYFDCYRSLLISHLFVKHQTEKKKIKIFLFFLSPPLVRHYPSPNFSFFFGVTLSPMVHANGTSLQLEKCLSWVSQNSCSSMPISPDKQNYCQFFSFFRLFIDMIGLYPNISDIL